jgi:hypothetical protein
MAVVGIYVKSPSVHDSYAKIAKWLKTKDGSPSWMLTELSSGIRVLTAGAYWSN